MHPQKVTIEAPQYLEIDSKLRLYDLTILSLTFLQKAESTKVLHTIWSKRFK